MKKLWPPIQRDVREYLNINDTAAFHKFMQISAARTGRLINYADMARDVGVSEVTVKTWLSHVGKCILRAFDVLQSAA